MPDKLEANTLRAIFRCTNTMQMALLDGHLQGLAEKNEAVSFGKSTQQTRVFEVDVAKHHEALSAKGANASKAQVADAIKQYVHDIEEDYRNVELLSLDTPQL